MTLRRSTEVSGFVNFPVDQTNTREGGMWVMLVVVDKYEEDNRENARRDDANWAEFEKGQWQKCLVETGALIHCGEVLLGDDQIPEREPFDFPENYETLPDDEKKKLCDEYLAATQPPSPAEKYHFPDLHEEYEGAKVSPDWEGKLDVEPNYRWYLENKYVSRRYMATVLLGSTGWSGYREGEEKHFRCTFDDLTDEGKQLYRLMEKLYAPQGKLHLLTYLDT